MKTTRLTAEELFEKHHVAIYALRGTRKLMNKEDFTNALTQDREQIKEIIDEIDIEEITKNYLIEVGSVDRKDIIEFDFKAGMKFALTELKSKI